MANVFGNILPIKQIGDIAKENKINYLEIFSCDFDTCLNQMISNIVFAVKPNFLITEGAIPVLSYKDVLNNKSPFFTSFCFSPLQILTGSRRVQPF